MTVITGRWVEQRPLGPYQGGDVGGDIQVTESWHRRWVMGGSNEVFVVDVYFYGCQDKGRRWIQEQIVWTVAPDIDNLDCGEEINTDYNDSYLDGSAEEAWPTDEDVKLISRDYVFQHSEWRGER